MSQSLKFKELANGSDIRGTALSDKDGKSVNLTLPVCSAIAEALVEWFTERSGRSSADVRITLGRDSRLSGPRIEKALIFGLRRAGVRDILRLGSASTPALFMSTADASVRADLAVMITASHLPRNRNGLKVFTREGGLESSDILDVLARAARIFEEKDAAETDMPLFVKDLTEAPNNLFYKKVCAEEEAAAKDGVLKESAFMKRYAEILRERVIRDLVPDHSCAAGRSVSARAGEANTPCRGTEKTQSRLGRLDGAEEDTNTAVDGLNTQARPLEGLKILVDAGNGSGGFYAFDVLEKLGAQIEGSLYLEPDGLFPHHIPNPEDPSAIPALRRAVLEKKADLGIIFDTDVDRAALIAADGREIHRNRLIALISSVLLEEEPGATIVTDSISSTGLARFIAQAGGVQHRFKRGYKNVINEAKRLNAEGISAPLAIETSGHAAFRENYFLDDGAYLATRLVITLAREKAAGRDLSSRLLHLEEASHVEEKRYTLLSEDFKAYGNKILADLECELREKRFALNSFPPETAELSLVLPNYEGLRVSLKRKDDPEEAWFLLRLSLHEPLFVLNLEGSERDCRLLRAALEEKLSHYPGVCT